MKKGLPHNEFIAQLRGVAALVVALMDYCYCFPIWFASLGFIGNGYYGVALFFAISGFLITSNMLARYGDLGSINLREFYVMRAARIIPCLGLAVAFFSTVALTTNIGGFVFEGDLSIGGAIEHVLTLSEPGRSQTVGLA